MLHFLWMFIVGVVVGLIARFILPGAHDMGLLMRNFRNKGRMRSLWHG